MRWRVIEVVTAIIMLISFAEGVSIAFGEKITILRLILLAIIIFSLVKQDENHKELMDLSGDKFVHKGKNSSTVMLYIIIFSIIFSILLVVVKYMLGGYAT